MKQALFLLCLAIVACSPFSPSCLAETGSEQKIAAITTIRSHFASRPHWGEAAHKKGIDPFNPLERQAIVFAVMERNEKIPGRNLFR